MRITTWDSPTRAAATDILHELLAATRDYPERVLALTDVPDVNKNNLAQRVKVLRTRLQEEKGSITTGVAI